MNWTYYIAMISWPVIIVTLAVVIWRTAEKPQPRKDEDEGGPLWL